MNDGDLLSKIQAVEYQTVPVDPSWLEENPGALDGEAAGPETPVTPSVVTSPTADVNQSENAQSTTVSPEPQPTIPQPSPEIARLQAERDKANASAQEAYRILAIAATQAQKAEEDAITNNPDLTEVERRAEMAEFRLKQQANRIQQLEGVQQQQAAQVNQFHEDVAHRQVANAIAMQHGIPFEHVGALMAAGDFNGMMTMAQVIRSLVGTSQPSVTDLRQQRVNSGVDVAGGTIVSPALPEKPKQRSGDLLGLIQSTGYTVQNR